MQTDWIFGLLGGGLIGLAGAIFLLANGRIMGASGILGGLLEKAAGDKTAERLAFLVGLVAVPLPLLMTLPDRQNTHLTENLLIIAIAGLLVGVGTRIANGCTSGHGVCGISRLSLRGIVATVFYILAGGLTLSVMRHVWGVI